MSKPNKQAWRVVWITGASSGIGREVAKLIARRGVKVAVSARSAAALEALAAEVPGIYPYPLDVSDAADVARTAAAISEELGAIDLALFNAAIWRPMGVDKLDLAEVRRSVDINFMGVIYGVDAVVGAMLARGHGHIAITSSVAGYRGLPMSAAYAPMKAALINLAETMRLELEERGVTVTIINPGFIDTPMQAENDFPKPFMISAEDAAQRMLRGLDRRAYDISFPWQLVYALWLGRILRNEGYFRYARWVLLRR
ncbi:MAG: SDR family NAD(P)-dependent oxidoreductase [Hyphomicrobiaceae bacterium]|nr:SDR family NAD(P)-dependent oxidoreductase [Hyphomicrobiaceae bacterium]